MVSLVLPSNHFATSVHSVSDLNFNTRSFSSWVLVFRRRKRAMRKEQLSGSLLRLPEGRIGYYYRDSCCWRGGFLRRCKLDWDSEGDSSLEAEIFGFMKNSKNPEIFPSKKDLMEAGRKDLVEAIVRKGGWLSFGWDVDDESKEEEEAKEEEEEEGAKEEEEEEGAKEEEEEEEENVFRENEVKEDWDSLMAEEQYNGVLQDRLASSENGSALRANGVGRYGVSTSALSSSGSASSSCRSLEAAGNDDSGIEGILNRLENERNINFGFSMKDKENISVRSDDGGWLNETTKDVTVAALKRSNGGVIHNLGDKLTQNMTLPGIDNFRDSNQPDNWRTWSIQRAGFSAKEFEAEEISFNDVGARSGSRDEILEVREVGGEYLNNQEEFKSSHEAVSHNQIRSRIQLLELELSSVLRSLRSNTDEHVNHKVYDNSPDDLHKFSDALEFQETEIMNALNRLRSTRAKLAILEGKMAMAIIDARKMVDEKQKRIDDAHRASQLIRTACIVWPNSASEVLLAGSFDGWSAQRKMKKSSAGIFSLSLKLYPGRYEIKFIVDGEWKIDPLRPIVHSDGYENNLLIIT